jgi:hypothetical protein
MDLLAEGTIGLFWQGRLAQTVEVNQWPAEDGVR